MIRSTHAAGYICAGACEAEVIHALVEGLLALSTNKTEEVQFAVGDALAFAFGGVSISADEVLRSNFESLAVSNKFFAGTEDTDMLDADGHALEAATPASSARDAAQEAIVNKIMQEYIYHSRSEVRGLANQRFACRNPAISASLDPDQVPSTGRF